MYMKVNSVVNESFMKTAAGQEADRSRETKHKTVKVCKSLKKKITSCWNEERRSRVMNLCVFITTSNDPVT